MSKILKDDHIYTCSCRHKTWVLEEYSKIGLVKLSMFKMFNSIPKIVRSFGTFMYLLWILYNRLCFNFIA